MFLKKAMIKEGCFILKNKLLKTLLASINCIGTGLLATKGVKTAAVIARVVVK